MSPCAFSLIEPETRPRLLILMGRLCVSERFLFTDLETVNMIMCPKVTATLVPGPSYCVGREAISHLFTVIADSILFNASQTLHVKRYAGNILKAFQSQLRYSQSVC